MTSAAAADTPAPVSPWERWAWVFAGIWLVFLVYPVVETFQATTDTWPTRVVGLTLLAAFGIVYVLGYGWLIDHPWPVFGLLIVLAAATAPIIGVEVIGLTPYLGVFSALQLPSPWWPRVTLAVAAVPLLSLVVGDGFPAFFFLIVWPVMVAMVLMRVFSEGNHRVAESRAALALVAERERVARDVHDVLGHSLTALSIKAELAARLIDVDPDRARVELMSIQDTARRALAEVRATVGGLRAANLDAELAAAPLVLADAGIETRLSGTVADTDPRHRALLAWVLRESVTNVVRHAGATTVEVQLLPTGLVVADDGAGFTATGGREGNGLRGMRERVAASGGTLDLSGGPGTRLEVVLP